MARSFRLTEEEYRKLLSRQRGARAPEGVVSRLTGRRWEEAFALQLDAVGVPYLREFKFQADRRFRFDFAFVPQLVAVEIDGAVHRIKKRFFSDREKRNLAVLGGWSVLHAGPDQVRSGEALDLLLRMLAAATEAQQPQAIDGARREA